MPALRKDILWSLSSNILPLFAGLMLIPLLIDQYGVERFGLITLVWALIGYFGLFDMGLSRALTQRLSQTKIKQDAQASSDIAFTGLTAMWGIGILAALLFLLGHQWLIHQVFNVSEYLIDETRMGFFIVIASIPLIIHTAGLKGIMDALGLFKTSSIIRMFFITGMFVAPYLAGLFEANLVYALLSIVIIRIITWGWHLIVIKRSQIVIPNTQFNLKQLKALAAFGGWVAVSNTIGPLMVYLDRFVISSLLGAALVAYYVAPYEVVTKMLVVPIGFTTVLFPLFSNAWQQQPEYVANIMNKGMLSVLILIAPIGIIVAYSSTEWLGWWLTQDFSQASTAIVSWLTAGVIMNSLAQILYAYIQGCGRSDLTAKLHLLEALPYWVLLWILIQKYQLTGAAIAWFIRSSTDCLGLVYLSIKLNKQNISACLSPITLGIITTLMILYSLHTNDFSDRMYWLALLLGATILVGIRSIFSHQLLKPINKQ